MSHASIRPDGGIAAQAIVCAAPLLGPYRQESLPNLVGRLEIRRRRIFAEHLSLLIVQERLRQHYCESCPEIPATHSTPAPSGFPRPPKLVGHPTRVALAETDSRADRSRTSAAATFGSELSIVQARSWAAGLDVRFFFQKNWQAGNFPACRVAAIPTRLGRPRFGSLTLPADQGAPGSAPPWVSSPCRLRCGTGCDCPCSTTRRGLSSRR
jgi:hypothetical protein